MRANPVERDASHARALTPSEEETMKPKRLLLPLLLTAIAATAFAANRPSGFTTICNEGHTCSVAANTNVAFGRADHFVFKVLSGSFVCSEATFGARTAGGVNE